MARKVFALVVLVWFVFLFYSFCYASVPGMINYQGKLTTGSGGCLNDTVQMVFSIYPDSSISTASWSETQAQVAVKEGIFSVLLGSVNPIPDLIFDGSVKYLGVKVESDPEMTPRKPMVSVAYAYRAGTADGGGGNSGWVDDGSVVRLANNTDNVGIGTTSPSGKMHVYNADASIPAFVVSGSSNAIFSLTGVFKVGNASGEEFCIEPHGVAHMKRQSGGYNLTIENPSTDSDRDYGAARFIANGGVYAIRADGKSYFNGNVGIGTTSPTERLDVAGTAQMTGFKMPTGASAGRVLTSDGSGIGTWQAPAGGDNDWTIDASDGDTTLFTGGAWGISRYGNILLGTGDSTHVNLGVACTTGTDGWPIKYCTVGGGGYNTASEGDYATVEGGWRNTASNQGATVGGGERNKASGSDATVGGGFENTASGSNATVAGGHHNLSSGDDATVGGGEWNTASGEEATVGGGFSNTSAGSYSFTTGNSSTVPVSYTNSAAFNGQTATASGQIRVGVLSKASGSFTIDHPLDPDNKILNHYFIESPEMINIYRGVVHLDANGKAEIHLPDYFDALNRNTMVQLTGVGTSDVFVAEEVSGNRFVIGGKPGIKVYWMVTGDRKDPSAEITRIIMPVEQVKTEDLVGRSLDDEFLGSTMQQLERMGEAGKFSFRTNTGRQRYEDMKRKLEEKKPGR